MPLERVDTFYDLFNAPSARESAFTTMHALLDTRPTVARSRSLEGSDIHDLLGNGGRRRGGVALNELVVENVVGRDGGV